MIKEIEKILNDSLQDGCYPGDESHAEVIYKEDIPLIIDKIKALVNIESSSRIINSHDSRDVACRCDEPDPVSTMICTNCDGFCPD